MKSLTTTICMVLLTLFAVTGYSQRRQAVKPSLFTNLPATINFTESQLNDLFIAAKGQPVNLATLNNFILTGSVASNTVKYSNLQTIIIALPAFKNTLFSLSKQTAQNNKNTFVGRILNPFYNDGFELKHDAAGNYQLIKINTEKIFVNCNQ